jgi:hypothetical protein
MELSLLAYTVLKERPGGDGGHGTCYGGGGIMKDT